MKNIYQHLYRQANILGLSSTHPRLQMMISLVTSLDLKDKKILDIGCNDGTFLTLFRNQTDHLYGLDGSPQAVARCLKNKVKAQVYFFDDQTPVPFPDKSFDLIVAGEIIEHIYDTDYFLREVYRLLKPHGYLLLSTPNIASLGRRLLLFFGINPLLEISPNYPESCGHIRYFTRASLNDLFSHHRFTQIRFTSDIVNFDNRGLTKSKLLAKLFPSIGQSLICLYQKS